jgi:hypothetical protein
MTSYVRIFSILGAFAFATALQTLASFSAELPPAVKSEIANDIENCDAKAEAKAAVKSSVKTADANRDGQPDYILDEGKLCETGFCGSGGCSFLVFLSGPDGVKKVFSGLGSSPKLGAGFFTYIGASGRAKVKISGYNVKE